MGVKVDGGHGRSEQNAVKGNWIGRIAHLVFFCFYLDKQRFNGKSISR